MKARQLILNKLSVVFHRKPMGDDALIAYLEILNAMRTEDLREACLDLMATSKYFPKPVEILEWTPDNSEYVSDVSDLAAAYSRAAQLDYDEYLKEMVRLGEIEGRPKQTIDYYRNELYRVQRECNPEDLRNITAEEYKTLPPIRFEKPPAPERNRQGDVIDDLAGERLKKKWSN